MGKLLILLPAVCLELCMRVDKAVVRVYDQELGGRLGDDAKRLISRKWVQQETEYEVSSYFLS